MMMKNIDAQDWEGIGNLPQILKVNARRFGSSTAIDSVDGTSYSYQELDRSARFLASMLYSSGIEKGSKVAILSENTPHWTLSYFGILTTGATTVPILPDFRGSEIISILEHAEARAIFVSGKLISRLDAGVPKGIEMVINLDNFQVMDVEEGKIVPPKGDPGKLEKLHISDDLFPGEERFYQAGDDDLASIIYTSGTTGRSKGVMLTHLNILSNAKQSGTVHVVTPEDSFLSMLPLAHSYESTIGMVVPLLNGARIHYIEKPPTAAYLAPLFRKLKPTTLLTVPMIMEKIYAAKIKPSLYGKPVMKTLMKFGPTRRMLSKVAARKLMDFFGGRVRFFGIGGAPLAPDVERFLLDGKFPYAIGYGLTETAPMLAGFAPENAIYRSVGKVMDGVTMRIDNPDPVTHEGEIVVKGSNIMKGYYKEPAKTAEVFTADGYFRTGDLGYIDNKGIIYIRGRLKNMILGANGENIYPEEIEAVINKEDIVSESLVMEVKGKLVAMVHLRVEVMEERFKHLQENAADFQQLLQEKYDEVLAELMTQVNQHVARNSKLQLMILQTQPFEKTPTQKIKRFLYQQEVNS
ncbi:MAG: AMP-binding protein [Bacteroidales bacterium]